MLPGWSSATVLFVMIFPPDKPTICVSECLTQMLYRCLENRDLG
jgi:hypothetical protein